MISRTPTSAPYEAGVHRPAAAVGHHREVARIVAALERGLADEVRHLAVDDLPDAGRGGDHVAAEERRRDAPAIAAARGPGCSAMRPPRKRSGER